MKILFSDIHEYEKKYFDELNKEYGFTLEYLPGPVNTHSARFLPEAPVLCSFVGDKLDRPCLEILKSKGVQLIALRCAGFNHVDLKAAQELQFKICRVPEYSPYAVAEFALGLLLSLNRKIHKSYARVRELNFSLEGLVGSDLHGKTVGVIGCGRIGKIFATTMVAMGCEVLIYDLIQDEELKMLGRVKYVSLDELLRTADVISLHVPLKKETFHILNKDAFAKMKKNVLIVNTGRGGLIETPALIGALKNNAIGGAALDVYEEEENIFFHDFSSLGIQDDVLARLLTFPNVLITSHQGFLTAEALKNIAETTLQNINQFSKSLPMPKENILGV